MLILCIYIIFIALFIIFYYIYIMLSIFHYYYYYNLILYHIIFYIYFISNITMILWEYEPLHLLSIWGSCFSGFRNKERIIWQRRKIHSNFGAKTGNLVEVFREGSHDFESRNCWNKDWKFPISNSQNHEICIPLKQFE